MSESQDTTLLIANRINQPAKETHKLVAQSLFDIIFENSGMKNNCSDLIRE